MALWFRMYNEVLDDPKAQRLPPELFKHWVNLLCLACKNGGKGHNVPDVSFSLRLPFHETVEVLKKLAHETLMVCANDLWSPYNWAKRQFKSDTSTVRVKRFRGRSKNVSEVVSVTDQSQSRAEHKERKISQDLVSKTLSKTVIRMNGRDTTWTPAQKKAAWQSKICREAQRIMDPTIYACFLVEWANGDSIAVKEANRIDAYLQNKQS